MKPVLSLIPQVSIHPDRVCFFNEVHWEGGRPARNSFSAKGLFAQDKERIFGTESEVKISHIIDSDRKSHGRVSIQAKRKMLKALDYMLLLVSNKTGFARLSGKAFSFKIAFITLTLPSAQVHPDSVIKNQCLNQFLIELDKVYHVKYYIWRAERQVNGNVHFHILIDKFVDWSELRNRWNRIINKLGYVDRYRDNMKKYFKEGFRKSSNQNDKRNTKQQYKAYLANCRSDFANPNSTDIHSIRKIHNIKLYISKYMTKNENEKNLNPNQETEETQENGNEEIKTTWESGRIWACSRNLSDIKGARCEVDSIVQRELEILEEVEQIKKYKDTYFTVYYINFDDLSAIKSQSLFKKFCKYLLDKFGFNYQYSLN